MKTVMLYITAKDAGEARKIGTALVKERLAACANIVDKIESVYRWKGKLEHGAEALLTAKTKESLAEKAIGRARELHSYECPCIVAFPIVKGNPAFLKWISHETL
jgi:periplasmic divalent cation tolerance protein